MNGFVCVTFHTIAGVETAVGQT